MEQFNTADTAFQHWLEQDAAGPEWQARLSRIALHSPHLRRLLEKYPGIAFNSCRSSAEAALRTLYQQLDAVEIGVISQAELMHTLRVIKNKAALAIALADISGHWQADQVTHHLTALADKCLRLCVNLLLLELHQQGIIQLEDAESPSENCGFFVLAMGKMGAHELNYSSDIDIMLLYDPELLRCKAEHIPQRNLIQLGNRLIELMQSRTEDGYVFRVDVRLRPDPASTPMVLSTTAAISYYETVGQNWERAALIKARPAAGDLAAAEQFLSALVPYIWRKYLDFAAIADIQSIRRQIDHKIARNGSDGKQSLDGYNVKLGAGGIRDIEFFTQTHQLIWGGKHPSLRLPRTEDALRQLTEKRIISHDDAEALITHYWELRRVEHAVQMLRDEQTHCLPGSAEDWEALAALLHAPSVDALQTQITTVCAEVEHICRADLQDSRAGYLSHKQGNLVFTGVEDDPDTLRNLEAMGFADASFVTQTIRSWHHGHIRATRTERARQLLTELTPAMLDAFAQTGAADIAFQRFNHLFSALPEGVQLLSLFAARPVLLQLLADIMSSAENLADMLRQNPRLLDRLLDREEEYTARRFRDKLTQNLVDQLAASRDMEDSLQTLRQVNNEYKFIIAVRMITGEITVDTATQCFTQLAEQILTRLVHLVQADYPPPDDMRGKVDFAVLAMGKLGSGQMSFASDLDLVFLYDVEGDAHFDSGSPASYASKLTQRIITASSALMKYGRLYEIDLRLRPYGGDSPPASKLATFTRYYAEDAWSYEWFALTRARIITGDERICESTQRILMRLLTRRQDREKLKADLYGLRSKIQENLTRPTLWDVKYQEGGLLDLEFVVQYLQLVHAADEPTLLHTNTEEAIQLLTLHGLIDKQDAVILHGCYRKLLHVQQVLRVCSQHAPNTGKVAHHFKRLLSDILQAQSYEAMEIVLKETYMEGYRIFRTLLNN